MPALEKCILHFCLNKLLLCSFCSSALACVWEFFVPYLHSFKCAEQESGLSINVFWKIGKCKLFSCVWLCDHMDCSQARLPLCMEFSRQEYWSGVAIPFSRWSSQPRDQTQVFSITGRFFTIWATREARVLNKWPGITSLILCPSSTMCRLMPKESTSTRWTLLGSICQEKQSNPNHMAHTCQESASMVLWAAPSPPGTSSPSLSPRHEALLFRPNSCPQLPHCCSGADCATAEVWSPGPLGRGQVKDKSEEPKFLAIKALVVMLVMLVTIVSNTIRH